MLEQLISFRTSDTILFGNNAIDQVQDIIKTMNAKRILVITDKGIVRCGLINRLNALLQPFRYTVYDDIEETPDIETIREITRFARSEGFDLLIGFGGGSPMDATKAVSAMLTNDGDIEEYLGSHTIRVPGLRKILITTTAGTGSEVTIFSVLGKREKGLQKTTGIYDKHMLPEWAIIDPTLTIGLPSFLTANTGIDALSHSVECYVNKLSNFLMEPPALESIKRIARYLEKATANGADLEARYNLSAGSVLAGIAFSQTGTGLTHALAETIQIPFRIAHGAAIGVLLPHVMKFNLAAATAKYAEIARAMGVEPQGLSEAALAQKSVQKVKALNRAIGIKDSLAELGVMEKDLETIAKDTMILGPGYVKKNPRPASEQDLLQILRNAFQGS
jgi:alcohol dehydrogenase